MIIGPEHLSKQIEQLFDPVIPNEKSATKKSGYSLGLWLELRHGWTMKLVLI